VKCYPLLDVSTSDSTMADCGYTIYVGNNADGVQALGYTGEGVITSVIDPGGINFDHQDFQVNSNTRVLYIWDQTTGSGGSNHPTDFDYGTEYDSTDIDNGSCAQTAGTHGNNCIGIMAGNGAASSGTYKAMALESYIVYVKCSSSASSTYLQDGIDYVFGNASSLSKPSTVSISLGNQYGPHDGTSLRNEAIDNLCGAGKIVCFVCGNSGSKRNHADATITQESSHTFNIDVIASDFDVDFWFSGDDTLQVYVDPPNIDEIGPIAYESSYEDTTSDGIIEIYNCTDSPSNNDHHIVVYASPDDSNFATCTWCNIIRPAHLIKRL